MRRIALGGVLAGACFVPRIAAAATLEADYQFQQTFASSVGTAPNLTEVNTGTATGGTFAQATVYGQTQYVYSFTGGTTGGEGLQADTANVVSPDTYSVIVDAEISVESGFIDKLLDFKNRTSDAGLYSVSGIPTFYNAVTPVGNGTTPVIEDVFAELALTRDDTGAVTVYLNGTDEFSFDDSTSDLATIGDTASDQVLDFFVDDPNTTIVTTGLTLENPSGEVAQIRLYDGALTAGEVASISAATVPEPSLLGISAAAMLCVLRRRRGR